MDDTEESLVHGLEQQARCLRAVAAQQDKVCVLDVEEDSGSATKTSYIHTPGEIWHLASHPTLQDTLASCHSTVKDGKLSSGCTLWRLPSGSAAAAAAASENGGSITNGDSASNNGNKPILEQLCTYQCSVDDGSRSSDATLCFEWEPSGGGTALIVHGQNKISTVDFHEAGSEFPALTALNWSSHHNSTSDKKSGSSLGGMVHSAVWEPYPGSKCIVAAVDSAIRAYDLRANGPSYSVENAHGPAVRCVDLNPNRPHVLASGGDDGQVRLWDARRPLAPLATVAEHSHWVWSVRFNPIHDQLLLSASSDGLLILHSFSSHSSDCVGVCAPAAGDTSDAARRRQALERGEGSDTLQSLSPNPPPPRLRPLQSLERHGGSQRLADGVLRRHESHEESVYACDWAPADPWRYASLSYHGRVIVETVARQLKYAILNVD